MNARHDASYKHLISSPNVGFLEPILHKPNRLGLCYIDAMPTILRFDGLRAVIYPNDHRPSHVHVIGKGGEAVFILHCPSGPPELRESYHFNSLDLNRIASILSEELLALCAKWREIHGHYG